MTLREGMLEPEGPQRDDLADVLLDAFTTNPVAGEFFDSIAQFYRHANLRYITPYDRRRSEDLAPAA